MFTVHAVDSDCCIFWDLDSNLIHFVEDNLLTIAPNNQAGDKLHARKVCQASFPASLKITFAPYGRAFSPGRKMGTQMFHGEKLKLNWRTMFSDLFWRCMQDNRDVLELFLLELVLLGKVSVWKMCVISTIECSNIDFTFCVWNLGCPGHLVGDTTARCFYLSDSIKGWDSTKPPHRWPIVTRRTFTWTWWTWAKFRIRLCKYICTVYLV